MIFKKSLIFLFVFFTGYLSLYSQTVNGKLLSEIDTNYLQITLSNELFSTNINIIIDYGQEYRLRKNAYLLDESGNKIEFNSFVHASNFLFKIGFEYVDVKTIFYENVNHNSYIYTYKKKSAK